MIKQILSIAIAIFAFTQLQAAVVITDAEGWFESAYVKWTTAETDTFNVYYSGEGITDEQIDTQLIRSYGSYYRADVLGLKAGSYTIKIVPVVNDVEDTANAATTASLTVSAFDRSGFAFSNNRVPGAYKADGTMKDGALVLYITEKTKNTISVNVAGANANPCVGLQTILDGFKKGNDTRPLIVRLIGQITDLDYMDKGDIVIENKNNENSYITLEGVGDDAVADGWGIRIKNASNVEIRNLATMNCDSDEGDNIGLQQDNDYVWVHNCDFFYGHAGSASDQQKGDGALDCKKSKYVTFSYNHFWDTGKSSLLGNDDDEYNFYITYHHNWFDHADSRHPRVRCFSTHVYNNYYDGIAKYGVGATVGSSIFAEANYFRNCKSPMLISMQGSDVWDSSKQANDYTNMPTFSKDDGGIIKAYNNYIEGATRFVPYGDTNYPNPTVDFDAYVVSDRNTTVPNTVTTYKGGNTYNNFDTNASVMYSYTADSPADAKTKVMQYAGRMFRGDFEWTFNNSVDDDSSDVNAALKTALTNYATSLVSIQGDGTGTGGGGTIVLPGDETHNFTTDGTASTFYTISGNLATKEGSIEYNGVTLSQYLKIESSTTISFTPEKDGTLTLVFNSNSSGKTLTIDGNDITIPSDGIVAVDLTAETEYTIKRKSGESYLYYMSVEYDATVGIITTGKEQISVYPNPVVDRLYINSGNEVLRVEIYGLAGNLIQRLNGNISEVDMTSLNAGSYFVRIYSAEGVTGKIIIKR